VRVPRVTVRQGACRVNVLWLVHSGPGFIHLRGDMRAKYAEVSAYSGTTFYIEANERTLHTEPKESWAHPHGMTEVRIHAPGGKRWTVEATISRYTLEAFCYTTGANGRFVWSADDEAATSRRTRR
jgi:hypothetical protein